MAAANNNNNKGPALKIIIQGASGTGKSSLLQRYTIGTFDEHIASTIGVDFRVSRLNNPLGDDDDTTTNNNSTGESSSSSLPFVRLEIWDTAGQERFKTLSSSYYRNAAAAMFVYDVTSRESFDALRKWMEDTITHCGPNIVMMLVANKIDRIPEIIQGQQDREETGGSSSSSSNDFINEEFAKSQEFAREHQMSYCRCSAKTKEGVVHAFEHLARLACQKPEFKEKYGLASGNNNSNNSNNNAGGDSVGKRIDLNRTANNSDDANNGGYGCAAC